MAQIAFRAGGRRTASCSELKPEYEVPYMPTAPVDQRLGGQPGDHLGEIGLLLGRVLVGGDAAGGARAPHVDPGHGEAALVGQAHVLAEVGRGQVVLAVGQRLDDDRPRTVAVGEDEGDRQRHAIGHLDPHFVLAHAGISSIGGVERALPRSAYVDPEVWEAERERLFAHQWVCVAREEDVPEPGDVCAVDVAGESVLLVRDGDALRGFYNVCRHRGSQLVDPGCSTHVAGGLRCPYHAWTYGLDGGLRRAPFVDDLDTASFGLHPVGLATWGGWVFVHLTPTEAPPLADQLGPIPERLRRYPLADLRRGARLEYDVAANWKVIAENFNECYHCGPVHPELCELVPAFRSGRDLDWEDGVPHREGAWTFTESGTSERQPFPDLTAEERIRHKGELIYPNVLLSLSADHAAALVLLPHGRRSHTGHRRVPLRRRRDGRPVRRGHLLGPHQPSGLAGVRAGPARDELPGVHPRLVRPHGGRERRHPPLVRPADGRGRVTPAETEADVVVIGLGALGSAAAWACARRGVRVIGLEQFDLGHDRGASQDHSRIIRLSYHTPHYVRLAKAAYEAWDLLAADTGDDVVTVTGGLDLFPAGAAIDPADYRSSMDAEGVPYEDLTGAEVKARWPAWSGLADDVTALFQERTGFVAASRAVAALQRGATDLGAVLRDRTKVVDLRVEGAEVVVTTDAGTVRAAHAVVAADAWTNQVLAPLGRELALTVLKEQVTWFEVDDPERFTADDFPVWIWMDDPSWYGFPAWDGAIKAAQDCGGRPVDPDTRTFDPDPENEARLSAFLHARRGWSRRGSQFEDLPLHAHAGPGLRAGPRARGARGAGRARRRPQLQVRRVVRPHPGRTRPRRSGHRGPRPVRHRPTGARRSRRRGRLAGVGPRLPHPDGG